MHRSPVRRPAAHRGSVVRQISLALLSAALVVAATPRAADAQFGALKKLKELKDAVSGPDSAAKVKDSLAKVHAIANGEVALPDTGKEEQSFFSRAKAAATKVSDKVESTTGVSVKDAALAASGAGLAGIAAKKLGVDPSTIAGNLVGKATEGAQKKAAQAQGAVPGIPGMPGGVSLQAMRAQSQAMQAQAAMQAKALKGMATPIAATAAMLGAMPDAQLMMAFQQSMAQVAMEATAGNPVARAKMEAWSGLAEKYETQAQALSATASAGDMAAITKLQALQVAMMREWLSVYGNAAKAKP